MTKFPHLIINPYFTILFSGKKGVIFMTSFVRKRGKTWSYYFEIELNGKRRQISKGGFAKKSDAKSAMAEAIVDYEQRNFLNISKVRLDSFFEDWLENTVRPLRSRTTYLRYQSLYDIYIRPAIGGELLTAITPIKVDRTVRAVRTAGRSETTVQHVYGLLRQVLHRAAQLRLIRDNPCEYIDRPKRAKSTTEVLTEPEILAVVNALDLHNASDYIFYIGFLFALETGCRRGEMCGLEWSDINWETRTISIERALTYVNGHVYVGAPKTEDSVRTLELSPTLTALLRSFRAWQAEERLKFGPYRKHNVFDGLEYDFVFSWPAGNYVHPLWWTKRTPVVMRRAGIDKHIRLHDLRHTSATLLIQQGIDLKTVQNRLGHTDPSMIMQRYGHVTKTMASRAVTELEDAIYGSRKIQ